MRYIKKQVSKIKQTKTTLKTSRDTAIIKAKLRDDPDVGDRKQGLQGKYF